MLGSQKFVFSLCLCNKVPYILMESSYYYYLLSISFGYVFCLHMLCIKKYRKISVGETHRDNKIEFDRKNHKIQKVTREGSRPMKRALSSPWSRPPSLLYGLAGPSLCHLSLSFVLGQDRAQYTLFLYVLLSILNQIENPLINNFKT